MFAKYNSRNFDLKYRTKIQMRKQDSIEDFPSSNINYEKNRHLEDYVYVFEVSSENKTDITSKLTEVD